MPNAVFSCPKCGQALGDMPASGRLVAVCAKCRLKYEVVRGRVSDSDSRQITVRAPGVRDPGKFAQRHELRLELPSGRTEMVTFELLDANTSIRVRTGEVLYAIYLLRGTRREQLLSVHDTTTGQSLKLSLPGEKATRKAWWFAGAATVVVYVVAASLHVSAAVGVVATFGTFIGLGVGLGHRFMPRTDLSPEEEAQLTAAQRLLADKLNVESERARTIRELEARRELRDRLVSLKTKMVNVGLELYQSRIVAIDRALALIDTQLELEVRLRDGYERSIQMIEIELEAGAAAEVLDGSAAPHIAAGLAEMRDLEEQQAELARQLAANVEVEALLKAGKA